jgi:hypothetical protein
MNTIKDALGIERAEKDKPVGEQLKDAASGDEKKSAEAREALKDEARDKAESANASIRETADSAKEGIKETAESVKEKTSSAVESAKEKVHEQSAPN